MYCVACGIELPDSANFCLRCGKPQREGFARTDAAHPLRWEICEIDCYLVKFDRRRKNGEWQFKANAIGKGGKYCAGKTESVIVSGLDSVYEFLDLDIHTFDVHQSPDTRIVHSRLIAQLVDEGWNPAGNGTRWFNTRFKRFIRE